MRKNLFIWQVCGVVATAVLGTILHFLFQWTNLKFFALISAVNESTWEHMKLVFIPSFLFVIIQSFWFEKECKCYWLIKGIGIIVGTLLIPILFYTLTGCFGNLSTITNVLIFIFSIVIEYFFELFLFSKLHFENKLKWLIISILVFILFLFFVFSFYPPKLPLFLDPLTKGYGLTN